MLRCPRCGEIIVRDAIIQETDNEMEWGTLHCNSCDSKYPVAFGIPIMMPGDSNIDAIENDIKHVSQQKRISVKDIVRRIESGNIDSVKKDLLLARLTRTSLNGFSKKKESGNMTTPLTKRLPEFIVKLVGKRNLYVVYWFLSKLTFQNVRYRKKENKIYSELLKATSAKEFIYQYFKKLLNNPVFNYFTYKFGQPRFLVGQSLLMILPFENKPILDIACGVGHTVHYLTFRNSKQPVIGVDRNFAKLYLAKKIVAPRGNYFCAEADYTLPFADGTFAGIFCSDAFEFFTYREASVRDMKRVLNKNGVIIITRILSVTLKYYRKFRVVFYDQLKRYFSDMNNIILEQDHILERYIHKKGPDLANELPLEEMENTGWVSIVASHRKDIFKEYGTFNEWPHALGYLKINPLYLESGRDTDGSVTYKFTFPDKWYEYEDNQWKKYAPETIKISKDALKAISDNKRTPEVNDLISKFVVLGMPQHYL